MLIDFLPDFFENLELTFSRRQSINPSDVAELLKPKNRKSQSRIKLKDSGRAPRARTSQIQFDLPKKIYSDSNRGPSGTGINKTKSILKAPKATPEEIYRDQKKVILLNYCQIETDNSSPRKFDQKSAKRSFSLEIFCLE